jgi:WD40 repeat protein
MARDVQRYLDNQPVFARPPSTAYRVAKFVRRNKMASTAVAAFAVALAIGLSFTTWQWIEKSEAYRRIAQSEQSEIRLREEAVAARGAAEIKAAEARRNAYAADMNLAQQALAVNNLGRARELLARYLPTGDAANVGDPDLRGWEWRYLWQHCRSDALFDLSRASNSVSSLSVSSEGHWVAAGEYANAGISVWDLRSRREVVRFPSREFREPFQFSPTAPLFAVTGGASASNQTTTIERPRHSIRLWDGEARRFTAELPLEANCKALQFSADGSRLIAVTDDLSVVVWEVATGRVLERRQLKGVGLPADPFAFRMGVISRDLKIYADGVAGRMVRVFNLATGEELWSAEAADENLLALALSPDGSLLATGGGYVESMVRLWDVASGTEIAQLSAHRTYVRNLVFWPDGQKLASASGDQTIHVWDVSRVTELAGTVAARDTRRRFWHPLTIVQPEVTLRGHQDEVWSLALAPDNHTLVSGGKDGLISVWETVAGAIGHEPVTLPVTVKDWSFTPDSESILVFDEDHRLVRWHGTRFQERSPIFEFNTNVGSILISPDGELVAANRSDKVVEVLNLTQCTLQQQIGSPDDPQSPVTFLASSKELVTHQLRTGAYCKWDLDTGE